MMSWIIHILAVKSHDIVEHLLSLDSRTIGVEFDGLNVVIDGLVPLTTLAGLVTLPIPLLCCHFSNL